jgi:hypothetical protein
MMMTQLKKFNLILQKPAIFILKFMFIISEINIKKTWLWFASPPFSPPINNPSAHNNLINLPKPSGFFTYHQV